MTEPSDSRAARRLSSVDEAQKAMPRLIAALNDDPGLARAALANPLFAIEELGYTIDEDVRTTFERRIRFTSDEAARLQTLAEEISKAAGCDVDVDDPYELARVLFEVLDLPRPDSSGEHHNDEGRDLQTRDRAALPTEPLDPRLPWVETTRSDPLEQLAGVHPVMKPLLEYRQLDATQPRLASPDAYRRARDETTSVSNVSFRRHTETDPSPGHDLRPSS
jgi:hypothetical protein